MAAARTAGSSEPAARFETRSRLSRSIAWRRPERTKSSTVVSSPATAVRAAALSHGPAIFMDRTASLRPSVATMAMSGFGWVSAAARRSASSLLWRNCWTASPTAVCLSSYAALAARAFSTSAAVLAVRSSSSARVARSWTWLALSTASLAVCAAATAASA